MMKFPPNSTHLVQPADTFFIQKINDAWKLRWEKYKLSCVIDGCWTEVSGKIPNPCKLFLLKLSASAVQDVNAQRDKEGLRYARRSMIMTGISLNGNGNWEELHLSQQLQSIVAKHRAHFYG